MAEVNPPLFLDADNAYGADELGLPYRDLIGEGVVAAGDLAVSQHAAGANMSVDVAAGVAWIQGDFADTQPTYRVRSDSVKQVFLDAADPALARIDLIYAQVLDSGFSGSQKTWLIDKSTGDPSATPVKPTVPPTAIPLAFVAVAAAASSITTANITDARQRAIVGFGAANGQAAAKASRSTAQSIPNGINAGIVIPMTTEVYDSHGFFDLADPSKLVVPAGMDGIYRVSAFLEWTTSATGQRRCYIRVNGTDRQGDYLNPGASLVAPQSWSAELSLVAGDYVQVIANQNSGAAIDVNQASLAISRV